MISRVFGWIVIQFERLLNRCRSAYIQSKFKSGGVNVYIGRGCIFTPHNISVGSNVYFAPGCVIQSMHGEIIIGSHVMFGSCAHIHGGNHLMDRMGEYMDMVKKDNGVDGKVVIEDDVWIGANAIILKGVHIGTGAVIGAGSVVTKNVPAYGIVVGNPGKVVRKRFSADEQKKHEELLEMNKEKAR